MALAAANLRDREALPDDLDVLVRELRDIDSAIASLRSYRERLNNAVLEHRPPKNFTAGGIGCEIRGGKDRKFTKDQHRDLAFAVAKKALAERLDAARFTGGVIETSEWEAVLSGLLACASIGYWRKGELAGREIDIDEYAESTPGRRNVVLLDPNT